MAHGQDLGRTQSIDGETGSVGQGNKVKLNPMELSAGLGNSWGWAQDQPM